MADAKESCSAQESAFVYIVQCADGTLYTGWAKDVVARVKVHNAGQGAQYTRTRRPVRLCYWERHPDRAAAMRRERQLKSWKRTRKLALIADFEKTADLEPLTQRRAEEAQRGTERTGERMVSVVF